MAAFIIYILRWAVALTMLYSLFGLFLKRETLHGFNRVVLLVILVASMVLPLCKIKTPKANIVTQGRELLEQQILLEERIVKKEGDGKLWLPRFADVNVCIPDFKSGRQNAPRLEEVERIAGQLFPKTYASGVLDGSRYRFKRDSIGIEQDKPLRCHYVNVRILFETINVI